MPRLRNRRSGSCYSSGKLGFEQTLEEETRKDGLNATVLADQEVKDRHKVLNQTWNLTPWLVLYALLTLLPGHIYDSVLLAGSVKTIQNEKKKVSQKL